MKKGFFALLIMASATSLFAQATPPSRRADAYLHFSQARLLDAQGSFAASIDEYKKALELDPKNSTLYSEMAQTYLRNRQVKQAVDAASTAVDLNGNNIDAHTLLSQVYWQQLIQSNAQPSRSLIDQAVHEYEEIIRIDPSDPQAFLLLGQLYQVINEPAKAEEIYKKHLNVDPGSEEGILALAELHIKSGDNKGAASMLENFLKLRGESDRALKALGDAYFYMEDFDKAADAYKKAIMLGSDDPDIQGNYAQALFSDDRFDEAASVYERIVRENPNDGPTLLRLSQIYRRVMKYDKARAALEVADKLVPNNPEIQFNLFLVDRDEGKLEDALVRMGKLVKGSEKSNDRYSDSEKQNRIVFLTNLAVLSSSLGRYDQAAQAYLDMKPVSPDKDRVDAMVVESYRAGKNIDMANVYLQKALKEAPNSRALLMVQADMIAEKGKVEDGIKALEGIVGGQPDLQLYAAMADIYQRAKKWDDAQSVLDRAVKSFPMESEVYFMQGALYEKQKKDADAERAFRKSLELDQDSPATLNYLGYMFADRGIMLDEALTMIQKAVDSDPINGAYLDSLGWVYFKMNRLGEAEQYLKKAVRFASNDSTMHEHLGDLFNKIGKFPEAAAEWQKALQLATEPKEADIIKKKLDQIKNKVPKKQL